MDRRSLLKELICAPVIGKLLSRAVIPESRIEGPESRVHNGFDWNEPGVGWVHKHIKSGDSVILGLELRRGSWLFPSEANCIWNSYGHWKFDQVDQALGIGLFTPGGFLLAARTFNHPLAFVSGCSLSCFVNISRIFHLDYETTGLRPSNFEAAILESREISVSTFCSLRGTFVADTHEDSKYQKTGWYNRYQEVNRVNRSHS